MALSECFKQATIYGDKTAVGMLCKMLEADTPYKLRQAWNEAYVTIERLVDSIIIQDIEDCIRGEN